MARFKGSDHTLFIINLLLAIDALEFKLTLGSLTFFASTFQRIKNFFINCPEKRATRWTYTYASHGVSCLL